MEVNNTDQTTNNSITSKSSNNDQTSIVEKERLEKEHEQLLQELERVRARSAYLTDGENETSDPEEVIIQGRLDQVRAKMDQGGF